MTGNPIDANENPWQSDRPVAETAEPFPNPPFTPVSSRDMLMEIVRQIDAGEREMLQFVMVSLTRSGVDSVKHVVHHYACDLNVAVGMLGIGQQIVTRKTLGWVNPKPPPDTTPSTASPSV